MIDCRPFVASLAPALVLLGLSAAAAAQTITVTTAEDVTDFPAPQTAAQLPGPDGRVSFREALTAANNMPGPQTVGFAIPLSDWWLLDELVLLRQEDGIFRLDDDGTTVDFTTQTAVTGDTNPDGHEVGIYGLEPNAWGVASIYVFGDDCVIKGLDLVLQRGYAVQIWGSHNRVIGCTISGPLHAAVYLTGPFGGAPSVGNIVGGTAPGEGNVLSAGNTGVRIDAPSEDNVVIGNRLTGSFAGVEVRGSEFTTTAKRNRIGGPTAAERNVIADAGHYGEEGFPVGKQIALQWAEDTLIEGNYIGTTPDGLASAGQIGPVGIEVGQNTSGTIIRDNLISGIVVAGVNHFQGQIFGNAIEVEGPATDTTIVGNLIGTDASGSSPLPNYRGIVAQPFISGPATTGTLVGGAAAGAGNTIAFNQQQGVFVASSFTGVTISGNSIHDNGLLGVDLAPVGPTPNDAGDADGGANGLQNSPVLTAASGSRGDTTITGQLDSLPNQGFRIEVFASAECDPSGFGEGAQFLGAVDVTTNGAGHADFVVVVGPAAAGSAYTATATQLATGNTSEFSPCLAGETGAWTGLGKGKAGTLGMPSLAGSGPLTPASLNQLALSGACSTCDLVLVVGPSELNAPFRGGTMVPMPSMLLPLSANAAGALSLSFTWPASGPSGLTLVLQAWVFDASASLGVSASNGLLGVTQ